MALTLDELRQILTKLGYEKPMRLTSALEAEHAIRSLLAGGFGEEGD